VETIAGQSRLEVLFEGQANHAGTTPMNLRHDALAGASEWIGAVEREARAFPGAVATVGRVSVSPGAGNVIPGSVATSLDVRHAADAARRDLVTRLLRCAEQIAASRCLTVSWEQRLDQAAVAMDSVLVELLERAVASTGRPVHRMPSGAGHDAMIVARRMPAAMLFLRSPGGISHHPDESVLAEDVDAALEVGMRFLEELERYHA
jgi:allantoate deiminase